MAFVQGKSTHWAGSSGTTESVTLTSSVTPGNLLVIGVGWDNTTTITAITASPSGTPVLIDTLAGATGNISTYYVKNATAGSTTVSVTWSADPAGGVLCVHEASADTTAPLDKHTTNPNVFAGTGTDAVTSGSVTPATDGQYLFGFAFDENVNGGTWTACATPLYVKRQDEVNGATEDAVQTTATLVAANWTYNMNSRVLAAIATFKAAAAGPSVAQEAGIFAAMLSGGMIGRVDA